MNAVSEVNDSPKLEELYNSRILQFAGNISRTGRLAVPDVTVTAHSRFCGSTVTVDIVLEGEIITDFAHEVRTCALGQASSSIMAQPDRRQHARRTADSPRGDASDAQTGEAAAPGTVL